MNYEQKYLKYKNKYNNLKSIVFSGGTIAELDTIELDTIEKVIVLIGELHTTKTNSIDYNNIIRKQERIIDILNSKYLNSIYFYSEIPEENRDQIFKNDTIHSLVVASKTILKKIPTKLSTVTSNDREIYGDCNDLFANDILNIFSTNPSTKCIVVAIGLLHLPELKKILLSKYPTIKIVMINTLSNEQIISIKPIVRRDKPSFLPFLDIEPTYELPRETFNVIVLANSFGEKVYKCPICKIISGTNTPKNPEDLSLFVHKFDCINKDKYPIEGE
jgi:hypothetical protein